MRRPHGYDDVLLDLSAQNAVAYLAGRGLAADWRVSELGGGVSNVVLLIESEDRRFVLKQALGKLRVEQDWFSDRRRIFRESTAMRALAAVLPVPEILFEDRANMLFAMSAAPREAKDWKSLLLAGEVRPDIAGRIGEMLAAMVRLSWESPGFERDFGDQSVFDQLRLDPYYRSTALRHPDLRGHFEALISQARRVSLVHGDWSPKNFLVSGEAVLAIDFEVIHFGDPSFDAAFLLNHLLLKSFYRPQWRPQYAAAAERFWRAFAADMPGWMEASTLRHLGGLLLARIDGKSPAEYIRDENLKNRIREFARRLIVAPPRSLEEVFTCE